MSVGPIMKELKLVTYINYGNAGTKQREGGWHPEWLALQSDVGKKAATIKIAIPRAPSRIISKSSLSNMIINENLKIPTRSRNQFGKLKCLNSSLMLLYRIPQTKMMDPKTRIETNSRASSKEIFLFSNL